MVIIYLIMSGGIKFLMWYPCNHAFRPKSRFQMVNLCLLLRRVS